ncbi:helix-turn-helix transcriptional regulator [Amycolatopsis sp. DSM 110486]|uniref:helix-turn-helix domain-containing protein n=1 Tax=Amycolatopsis sp. DSM 110486 TaxID=2865832 RepID=UPI001C6956A7|nr:helix-turn-helix transcriptional regulator [Amycolatopsis sp. DSM 110486]QYN22367.1 helix-turn-helix domain-containing protein [Amycolatopsis sp. DSM 110486]
MGAYLTFLRKDVGKRTVVEVAEYLGMSAPSVTRYENGDVLMKISVVRDMCRHYGASDDQFVEAERLFRIADDEPPPVRLPADAPNEFRRYLAAERDGVELWACERTMWPGLLQVRAYASALFDAAPHFNDSNARVENVIKGRLERQERLAPNDPKPLKAEFLVDEAVVNGYVGGPQTMAEQLRHVVAVMEYPNVTIRVIEHKQGAYGLLSGGYNIVYYEESDAPPGLYIEFPGGGRWYENPKDTGRFTASHKDARKLALSTDDTRDLLHRRVRALEGNGRTKVAEE